MLAGDFLELGHQFFQVFGVQVGVQLVALNRFMFIQHIFKGFIRHAQHHRTEHLDQAAVGVIHEAFVFGQRDHCFSRLVIQADIQNRVHHAGHGIFSAGAARYQQRIFQAAEFLAGRLFHILQGLHHLFPLPFGELVGFLECVASFGGYRKARRNRHADARHFSQIGTLSTQETANPFPVAANIFFSLVDVLE